MPTRPLHTSRRLCCIPVSSLQNYLFHSETRDRLDVLVWSSAHDKVETSFGEDLKAVWARDTLGLSSNQYCTSILGAAHPFESRYVDKKTQSTKDLGKPRDYFISFVDKKASGSPWSSRSHLQWLLPRPCSSPAVQAHSALTTLLLDDLPANRYVEPYNHNHAYIKECDAHTSTHWNWGEQRRIRSEGSGAHSPDPENDDDEEEGGGRACGDSARRSVRCDAASYCWYPGRDRETEQCYWLDQERRAVGEAQVQLIVSIQTESVPTTVASSSSVDNFDVHLDNRQKLRGASTYA
ncbi:hypothetical protein NEOLEDRAFT_1140608 [Neolentinus lepideus HHB14362 ss-1]|uniref:FCP1 homology domain-containing protein n=1 Tax=Neolentinus lepideus HHB14362 ss-1 TaxID=1314782 RepID=A0A165P4D5_9AGAM|nr:hypothetical protein NEOLEDRAFT_1140608 [Neolentinus lepideus HHB14362 ss-1]